MRGVSGRYGVAQGGVKCNEKQRYRVPRVIVIGGSKFLNNTDFLNY